MTNQYECLNPDCPIYKRGENFEHPSCYDCPYKVMNLSTLEKSYEVTNDYSESIRKKPEFAATKKNILSNFRKENMQNFPRLLIFITIPILILLIIGSFLLLPKLYTKDQQSVDNISLAKDKKVELLCSISGSSTIGEKLIPKLIKAYINTIGATNISEISNQKNKQLRILFKLPDKKLIQEIRITSKGSSSSFADLEKKQCNIGMSSREIRDLEIEKLKNSGFDNASENKMLLGLDGEAIIVNNVNRINNLSKEQLAKIFSGEITNWAEVGSQAAKINVYLRDTSSGSFDLLKSKILGNKDFFKNANIIQGSQEMASKVASDKNAIGHVGMAYIGSAKPIGISDGKTESFLPTPFNISTEEYLLTRRLYLYAPEQLANEFTKGLLTYINTIEAQQILIETDFTSNNIFVLSLGQIPTRGWKNADLKEKFDAMYTKAEGRLSINLAFNSNKSTLDEKSANDLQKIVDFLNRSTYLNNKIALVGFADNLGNAESNTTLSLSRAEYVYEELIKLNANLGDRIETIGLGDEQPIAPNDTDEGRNKNRRVEVWLLKK